jgi:Putative O-antigen polymerase
MGVVFLMLFGLGAIDAYVADETGRLRSQFMFYHGVSLVVVGYLACSFTSFAFGYWLPPAVTVIRHFRPAPRFWVPLRVTAVTTVSFALTFALLVAYTVQVGYGRYEGQGNDELTNLSLLGEMSMIPYAFGLLRDAQRRSGKGRGYMSGWDRTFLWGFMFPGQLVLSIVIGTRSRVVAVLLMAMAAHNYGASRWRYRTLIAVSAFLLAVVVPVLGLLRANDSSYNPQAVWDSLAGRTSAVETFAVIYENLDSTPEPDPLYWTVMTGLVPRFLWPSKPQSDASERLTYWAVGVRTSWAGATLPGDFLRHFGYAGGLAGMLVLGLAWRTLVEIARVAEGNAWTALYLVALPTLLTVESGFVLPYSVLIRFVAVTVLMLLASTAPAKRVLMTRPSVLKPRETLPVPIARAQASEGATTGQ